MLEIITHNQITDINQLSFQGLTVTLDETYVEISGEVVVKGVSYTLDHTFELEGLHTIFVTDVGTLTTDTSLAFAHLAWWDGSDLHVITHKEVTDA